MVWLLGFPGSTMRYAPSSRLTYTDQVAVPNLVADFGNPKSNNNHNSNHEQP